MADSLRDALESQLGTLPTLMFDNGYPVQALPKPALLDLLAMHRAESAPDRQPSDAAVEAAAVTWAPEWGPESTPYRAIRKQARKALEAAYRVDAPRPLLDREEVRVRLEHVWMSASADDLDGEVSEMTDAVMELARPMPTREQIARWMYISRSRQDDNGDGDWEGTFPIVRERFMERAGTVLALLNGAES